MPVPHSVSVWPGRWIWITTSLVLLAIASLLVMMSGNGPAPDYGSHLLWFW